MSSASVSVVVPFYNRSTYLLRLLDSVACQTQFVEKIFVVDNGSQRDEAERAWATIQNHQLSDRCCYVSTVRLGNANYARNLGYYLSKSDYVAYLDSDDWWEPDHLKSSVEILERSGKAGCYSGAIIHKASGISLSRSVDINEIDCPFRFLFSKAGGIAQSSSFVVSRKKTNGVVEWDERLKRCQDFDYFISIQLETEGWVYKPDPDYHLDWDQGGTVGQLDSDSIVRFYNKWSSSFPKRLEFFFVLRYISVFQERMMGEEIETLISRLNLGPFNRVVFSRPTLPFFRFLLWLRLKVIKVRTLGYE